MKFMSLMISVVVLIFGFIILTNLSKLDSEPIFSSTDSKDISLPEKKLKKQEIDSDRKEIEQLIFNYVEYSRKGEFSRIDDITMDTHLINQKIEEVGKERQSQNSANTSKIILLDTKELDNYRHNLLTKNDPILIETEKLQIVESSIKELSENQCRIQVDFISENGSNIFSQDYYLFRDESKKWKIYDVRFPKGDEDK